MSKSHRPASSVMVRCWSRCTTMDSTTSSLGGLTRASDAVSHADAPILDRAIVEKAITAAVRAPSLHNTQPWQWRWQDDLLEVRADRTRQLRVADPDGHSLLISCGAAVELTALALTAYGVAASLSLLPDDADPDLLARFEGTFRGKPDESAAEQLRAAGGRRSDRRVFGPDAVAPDVIERLRVAAQASAVYAHFPVREQESLELAVAISRADRSQRDDPAYAAELAQWIRRDPMTLDGVPSSVIPAVAADDPRHTDIPLRDFEIGIAGTQLIQTGADERPLIAVIFTNADNDRERLRAGQSMMRLMVVAELEGLASCPLSQSVDLLAFRSQLRTVMSWRRYPQMMLRLGQRPASDPPPLTSRRPVGDVLTVAHELKPSRSSRRSAP